MIVEDKFEFASHFSKIDKATRKLTLCFASIFEECEEKSINSHTISQTNLRLLAEDGHLLSYILPDIHTAIHSKESFKSAIKLKKIGLKTVSSFPGFCSTHDTNLFKTIDNPKLEITSQTSQLLAFRAFVHEAYKKISAQYKLESFQYVRSSHEIDRANNVENFQLGYADLMVQAQDLYENIKLENHKFKYLSIKFSQLLPFCFIAPINFEIKPAFGGKDPWAHVFYESCLIGLLPTTSGSNFVLAFPQSQAKNIKLFLKRLGTCKRDLPAKILQLALESCENLFFNPSWVEALTKEQHGLMGGIFHHDFSCTDVLSQNLISQTMLKNTGNIFIDSNTLYIRAWKNKLR